MPDAATSDLVAVEVTGADRSSYLDDVTTQRFVGAPLGSVLGWLVLDAKGAPSAMGWALVDDDRIVLLAPPAAANHVEEVLARRTFLADATFTRLPMATATLAGDDLADALAEAGVDVAPDTWGRVGDLVVVRHAFGVEVLGTDDATDLLPAANPVDDLDHLRIRHGEPRWGHEVVAGRLPEEYGLLATHVHLGKGCYPGQEPIAHMWMLGRPRRHLVRLASSADAASDEPGGRVEVTGMAGRRGLGFVRPDVGAGARVHPDRDREPGDDGTDAGTADLAVAGVVGADRDPVGWTPAQTRRRDRTDDVARPGRRP